jgi:predicted transcriptional regulator
MRTTSRPLIRLSKQTYATLKALSKETKKPISKIAEDAIARYEDERFWDAVDRELESWTPEQWRQYRKEFNDWDSMPGPGLPVNDWSEQWRAQQQRSEAEARLIRSPRSRVGQLT